MNSTCLSIETWTICSLMVIVHLNYKVCLSLSFYPAVVLESSRVHMETATSASAKTHLVNIEPGLTQCETVSLRPVPPLLFVDTQVFSSEPTSATCTSVPIIKELFYVLLSFLPGPQVFILLENVFAPLILQNSTYKRSCVKHASLWP